MGSQWGIVDFQVQVDSNGVWTTVANGTISGNNRVLRRVSFPAVTTERVRVNISNALASSSRLTEIEAWGPITPMATYHVHSDQLGTPRLVTRPADNVKMWQWESRPFGEDAPNANPAGAGSFAMNLRFPGQYYDAETGTHYNYFRDYDPAIGRYVQSDRIGLDGGLNTYAYAEGNPLSYADPDGLQVIACLPPFFCVPLPPIAVPPIFTRPHDPSDPFGDDRRKRGRQDPIGGLKPVNPERDCNGNCNPCPKDELWRAPGNAHGSDSGEHYHWIKWNRRGSDCMCFPDRGSGKTPPQGLRL